MFYEIISKKGKKSHLFGTIHINDQEVTQLPLEVKKAFCGATKVVFETDIFTEELAIQHCMMTLIQTWQEEYHTQEFPPILAGYLKSLSALDWRLNNALDKQLACEAKQQNKPLSFLESIWFQIGHLIGAKFNPDEQREWAQYMELRGPIDLDKLKKHYLDGNITEIMNSAELEGAPDIIKRYRQSFIFDRDSGMAETMKSHLEEGGAFIAIGAAHLPGVTNKLNEEGYIVNPIPLGSRVHPIQGLLKEEPETNVIKALGKFGIYTAATSESEKLDEVRTEELKQSLDNLKPKGLARSSACLIL